MDLELFNLLLDRLKDAKVDKLVFSGWGEPTVHPNIIQIMERVKKQGKSIILNTNGSTLFDIADDLIDLEVDEVVVSVSSFKENPGIRYLRNRRISKGKTRPTVKALFTITNLNMGELENAVNFAKEEGVREIYFSYYIPYPGGKKELEYIDEALAKESFNELFERLSPKILGAGVRFAYPGLSPNFFRGCPFALNRALFVRCDGNVAPCLYFSRSWKTEVFGTLRDIKEYILGNVSDSSLLDIWRRKYVELFFRLSFNHLPSCLECPFKKGCKFTSTNETDCWGNSPNCAHCPYLHKLSLCPL